jgi:hypothetical protein
LIARFTPAQAGTASPASERYRMAARWVLVAALAAAALGRRRWVGGIVVAVVGGAWMAWPQCQPWAVLGVSGLGLAALAFGQRTAFLWAAYWWVGTLALYLTGGTWGPPLGPTQDLNALGYRLGFQSFFASDILVIGALGCLAQIRFRSTTAATRESWLDRPSPLAARCARITVTIAATALGLVLTVGAGIVGWRLLARSRQAPVAYPALATLQSDGLTRGDEKFR